MTAIVVRARPLANSPSPGTAGGADTTASCRNGATPFAVRTRSSTCRASSARPLRIRNMGDSGTHSRRKIPISAGSAATT